MTSIHQRFFYSTMIAIGLVLGMNALVGSTASAQSKEVSLSTEDKSRAQQHYALGEVLVGQKKFERAYREFLKGYQISGMPLFIYNMAECSRELGRKTRAVRDYKMYVAQDPGGPMVSFAKNRLRELGVETDKPSPKGDSEATGDPPAATEPNALDRSLSEQAESEEDDGSFFASAPFWIGVGVVVVAGSITAIALASGGDEPMMCISPGCLDFR